MTGERRRSPIRRKAPPHYGGTRSCAVARRHQHAEAPDAIRDRRRERAAIPGHTFGAASAWRWPELPGPLHGRLLHVGVPRAAPSPQQRGRGNRLLGERCPPRSSGLADRPNRTPIREPGLSPVRSARKCMGDSFRGSCGQKVAAGFALRARIRATRSRSKRTPWPIPAIWKPLSIA